ncbi:MAG: SCO family protein [Burkholderiaceae bacterium]
MNDRPTRRDLLALLALAPLAAQGLAAPPPPGDSVYQLRAALVDQDGQAFDLASLRGRPVLASMFYSSCRMACPVIFETIHRTVDALAPAARERVQVLMVTLDPARDTVAVLKDTARAHGCDGRWHLVRGSDVDVRRIAAVLGVQYRRLPSGEFSHSSAIELLDAEGRIAARTTTMLDVDPALVAAIGNA